MSLSFVSKAIQTTAEDGTFEEKPVENAEADTGGRSVTGTGQGLFDQLRQNKEDAEAEREEFQRSIMRGTLALDEDDAAHLDQLNKRRMEDLARKQQQTATELATFRAAQADRQHQQQQRTDETPNSSFDVTSFAGTERAASGSEKKFAPTFIKKKRKRMEATDEPKPKGQEKGPENDDTKSTVALPAKEETKTEGGGISNLLAGYSSSSSEEDDNDE